MKKLFFRLLLVLSPLLAVLLLYVCKDPFKVIYHYDSYFKDKDSTVTYATNSDYVATQTFIQNFPAHHYDSYILGGSRSGYYRVSDWEKHINSTNTYHFNGIFESLYGIDRKLSFIDQQHGRIKNVLIVLDSNLLSEVTDSKGFLAIKHPALTGGSAIRFQLEFVKAFFDRKFLYAYCDHMISGKVKPYMLKDGTMFRTYFFYDAVHNETVQTYVDEQITYHKEQYYNKRKKIFYPRSGQLRIAQPVIKNTQLAMLRNIHSILQKNGTSYKIVINPLYDQVTIAPADLQILQQIFGPEHVYDFSGINDITNDKYNYYENSHYRPQAAARIMDSVYAR